MSCPRLPKPPFTRSRSRTGRAASAGQETAARRCATRAADAAAAHDVAAVPRRSTRRPRNRLLHVGDRSARYCCTRSSLRYASPDRPLQVRPQHSAARSRAGQCQIEVQADQGRHPGAGAPRRRRQYRRQSPRQDAAARAAQGQCDDRARGGHATGRDAGKEEPGNADSAQIGGEPSLHAAAEAQRCAGQAGAARLRPT